MDRIRELRQAKNLSQAKLAVTAGMDPATLNRIEQGKGNPNLKTLQRLAKALDVEVGELLPKAQAPPLLEDENARRGYQSLAKFRIELLEQSADLWKRQVDRGQYDLETIREIDSVAFRLALNHSLDESEIKQHCTPKQRELLERAEQKLTKVYQVIWAAFEAKFEEERERLSKKEVTDLERYRNERNKRRAHLANTGA
jgi:transcriptional regulator with XRE-family HTH domain